MISMSTVTRKEVEVLYSVEEKRGNGFSPFGSLFFQYVKMDFEGEEVKSLMATMRSDWEHMSAMDGVENGDNALALSEIDVKLVSRKRGWSKALSAGDMPVNYYERTFVGLANRKWCGYEGI